MMIIGYEEFNLKGNCSAIFWASLRFLAAQAHSPSSYLKSNIS